MKKPYEVRAVQRPEGATGWVKQPKRWVVERSIGWVGRNRRRSRDHEHTTGSSQAWIEVGAIGGMGRRLAPDPGWRSAPFRCVKTPAKIVARLLGQPRKAHLACIGLSCRLRLACHDGYGGVNTPPQQAPLFQRQRREHLKSMVELLG